MQRLDAEGKPGVVEHWRNHWTESGGDWQGTPASANPNGKSTRSAIVFKVTGRGSLRSWTDEDYKAQTSDEPEVRSRAEEVITVIENKLYPELILRGHGASVWRVCVSADGKRLLTCSGDRTLKLWDTHSGECLQIFK